MKENLAQYRMRTAFMKEGLPFHGSLRTAAGLADKVDEQGSFRTFCGDTVIFDLPQPMIEWLRGVQDALYAQCGAYLAQRIEPKTFHITLHDLLSQKDAMPQGVEEDRKRVPQLIEGFQDRCSGSIGVRSVCAFSMVGTSIVMGFEPSEEADCAALMEMYDALQSVVPLGYPLTLHATLAYYKPGDHGEEGLRCVRDALYRIGEEPREWRLEMRQLYHAVFESMARFEPA